MHCIYDELEAMCNNVTNIMHNESYCSFNYLFMILTYSVVISI